MKLLLMLAASALPLAGCGASPSEASSGKITVVAGEAGRGFVGATAMPTRAIAATPSPVPTATPRTLTVAESALIRTDEMWSEPIAPGDS